MDKQSTGTRRAASQAPQAQPPGPATLGATALKAQAETRTYLQGRERLEHRSVLRGLLLLAVIALLVGLYRADAGRVFFSGWWRQW